MKDERKTKRQLIDELTQLRQRLSKESLHLTEAPCRADGLETRNRDDGIRQRMEELLRASVEQWYIVFNTMIDAICLLDPQGRIQRCNRAMVKLVDRPLGEVLGRHCWEVVLGVSEPIDECPVVRMWESLSRESLVMSLGDRWFNISVDPLLAHDGQSIGAVFVMTDITERKQTQEERDRITDLSQDLICIAGLDGYFKFLNPAWEATLGYTRDELLSRPFNDLIHPDDHAKNDAEVKKLAAGEPTVDFEIRCIHKDGSIRTISWRATPVPEERLIYCTGRDVTERFRAEEERARAAAALRESEFRFRSIVENSADGIVLANEKGNIIEWNQAQEQLTEITRAEALGQSIWDTMYQILPEEQKTPAIYERWKASVFDLLRIGQASWMNQLQEMNIQRPDGTHRDVQAVMFPIKTNKGFQSVSICRDITEHKRVEEALRESEQRFRQIFARAPISIWEEDFSAVGDWLAELRARGVHDLDAFLQAEPQALEQALALVRLVDINDTTLQFFEANSKEELLNLWTSLFTDDTFDVFAEELRGIWQGRNQVDFECSAQTVRGRPIHYLLHWVAPLEDGRMNLRHVIVAIADITERKRSEEALQFVRFSVDKAPYTVAWVDKDAHFIDVNDAFCRSSGYARDELLQMVVYDIDPEHSAAIWPKFWERLKQNGSLTFESHHRTREGEILPVEITANYFEYNGKEYHCALARDVTERKQAEQALVQQAEQLHLLSARLAEVQEAERRRIARELHDQVGQNLTVLGINLNTLRPHLAQEPEEAQFRLNDSLRLVKETTGRIRDVMADLRPPELDDYGLLSALHWYADYVGAGTGLAVTVEGEVIPPRLSSQQETALFRITQEALTNVVKHAQATQATITVETSGEEVRMVIADDGVGFDLVSLETTSETPHWGLLTMQERAQAIGACWRLESSPGRGTRVVVELTRPKGEQR